MTGAGPPGGGWTGDGGAERSAPTEADRLLASFARWAADERAGEAAAARRRERWLRQQATEEATLAGTLVDLAERGGDVAVVVAGRTVTGRLVGVGADGLVVADAAGACTVVALAAVTTVRVAGSRPGAGAASGRRTPTGAWRMVDALSVLAAERSPVRIGVRGGEQVSGEVVAAGEDVLTVRLSGGGMRAHVAVAAVETCSPR